MPRIDTLSGNFKICQPDVGQRYSTDDMLTAWMAVICSDINPPGRFLDLGSGLCSVPMIVLWKFSQISGVGIELRENRRELGLKSLEMNGLSNLRVF
jgi:tRNA1(Val) A37 N6-methylase TrmN6